MIGDIVWVDKNADGIYDANGLDNIAGNSDDETRLDNVRVLLTKSDNTHPSEPFIDLDFDGVYSPGDHEPFTDRNGNSVYDGPESFTDTNNNGIYDTGETYIDADSSGIYTPAELWTDTDADGVWTAHEYFTDYDNDGCHDDGSGTTGGGCDNQIAQLTSSQTLPGNGSATDGSYLFTALPPDTYQISFDVAAYNTASSTNYRFTTQDTTDSDPLTVDDQIDSDATTTGMVTNITLAAEQRIRYVSAGIWEPVSINAMIWLDDDRDGTFNGTESGKNDVTVSLERYDSLASAFVAVTTDADGGVIAPITTTATGIVSWINLRPDTYRFSVTQPAGYDETIRGSTIDDGVDNNSDADPATGLTYIIHINSGDNHTTTDVGSIILTPHVTVSIDDSTPGTADTDGDDMQTIRHNSSALMTITLTNDGFVGLDTLSLTDTLGGSCTIDTTGMDVLLLGIGNNDAVFDPGESLTLSCSKTNITAPTTNTLTLNARHVITLATLDDVSLYPWLTDTTQIFINPANPPVAEDDTYTISEDLTTEGVTQYELDIIINDSDPEGAITFGPYTLTILSTPLHGSASISPAQDSIMYTPDPQYNGTDTLTYQLCDNTIPTPYCDIATVNIIVTPIDDAPLAGNDSATTPQNNPVTLSVLVNDYDNDALVTVSTTPGSVNGLDPASVTQNTAPLNGSITIDNTTGAITYTPNTDYIGNDTFSYNVCDDDTPALCTTATVNITINNAAPTAVDDNGTTPEDTPITISVLSNDTDPQNNISI